MKLLFVDIISPSEHKNYNYGILRNLPKELSVDICAKKDYVPFDVIEYNNYFEMPERYIYDYNNVRGNRSIALRVKTAQAYKWVYSNVPLNEYDVVLFTSTEATMFFFFSKNVKTRVIFADHMIGDDISNKIKLWCFKHINKNYEFMAFESYIEDCIKDITPNRKIWVVRHPLPNVLEPHIYNRPKDLISVVAPALSNDETFISFLISNEDKIPNNMKLTVRSKIQEYSSEKLVVYKNRISDQEYADLIGNADYVLINYGSLYNFRTSGVLYEAVEYKKPVLLYTNNTMKYYVEKYGNILFGFNSDDEFFDLLNKCVQNDYKFDNTSFSEILNDYSDDTLKKQINGMLLGE